MERKRVLAKTTDADMKAVITQSLAQYKGVEISGLSPEDHDYIEQFMNSVIKEKAAIKEIISPWYDTYFNENNLQKVDELINVGKMIFYLKKVDEIKILEVRESPDMLLQYKDKIIGLEITGIYDEKITSGVRELHRHLKRLESRLIESGGWKGHFNFIIVPSALKGQLKDKKQLDEIFQNIVSAKISGVEPNLPIFIEKVIFTQADDFSIDLGEEYWLKNLSSEDVIKAIAAKELKIGEYKANIDSDEMWLLVVIDGASSVSSFHIVVEELPIFPSKFDRVIIFDNFKGGVYFTRFTNETEF